MEQTLNIYYPNNKQVLEHWSIDNLWAHDLIFNDFFYVRLLFPFTFHHFFWRSHEIIYFIIVNVLYILFTHLLYTKDHFLLFEVCHPSTVWHLRLVLLFWTVSSANESKSIQAQEKWVIDWLYTDIKWSRHQEPKTYGF